jgi:hypothetical protein
MKKIIVIGLMLLAAVIISMPAGSASTPEPMVMPISLKCRHCYGGLAYNSHQCGYDMAGYCCVYVCSNCRRAYEYCE